MLTERDDAVTETEDVQDALRRLLKRVDELEQNAVAVGDYVLSTRISHGRNFMLCNGATLKITDFHALFLEIGTTYGGDGTLSFMLPDYRGRYPCGSDGMTVPLGHKLEDTTAKPKNVKFGIGVDGAHEHAIPFGFLNSSGHSGTFVIGDVDRSRDRFSSLTGVLDGAHSHKILEFDNETRPKTLVTNVFIRVM